MLKLKYKDLNTNKFHDELFAAGIIPDSVQSKDDKTFVYFFNINKYEVNTFDEETEKIIDTKIEYKEVKERLEEYIVEEPENEITKKRTVKFEVDFDGEKLIEDIKTIAISHDPSKRKRKKTLEERIEVLENKLKERK
jgi:alanine-alpha-ketoisovalerate/valine-pyruvate aminotransferase